MKFDGFAGLRRTLLCIVGSTAMAISVAATASAGPLPMPTKWDKELYSACIGRYGSSARQQCCVGTGGRWAVTPGSGSSCQDIGGPAAATIEETQKPATAGV
jgi:hypothetical protein